MLHDPGSAWRWLSPITRPTRSNQVNSYRCSRISNRRRQAALPRYIRERHTTKVGTDNLLRASLLPWREPTGGNPRYRSHASIGLSDVYPDRQRDVVDK